MTLALRRSARAAAFATLALVALGALATLPRADSPALLPTALAQGAPGDPVDGEPLCIIFITPADDHRTVEIAVDLVLTSEDLANVTRDVDADSDGNVTRAEVEQFERASVESAAWDDLGDKRATMDGQLPDAVLVGTRLSGFEGPVEAERKRVVTEVRTYAYRAPLASDVHELRGGPGAEYRPPPTPAPSAVVETVVIRSLPGWMIWSVNGTLVKQTDVTIRGFDTKRDFVVRWVPEEYDPSGGGDDGGWFIPGPGAWIALGALAAGAVVLPRGAGARVPRGAP